MIVVLDTCAMLAYLRDEQGTVELTPNRQLPPGLF